MLVTKKFESDFASTISKLSMPRLGYLPAPNVVQVPEDSARPLLTDRFDDRVTGGAPLGENVFWRFTHSSRNILRARVL